MNTSTRNKRFKNSFIELIRQKLNSIEGLQIDRYLDIHQHELFIVKLNGKEIFVDHNSTFINSKFILWYESELIDVWIEGKRRKIQRFAFLDNLEKIIKKLSKIK